MVKSFEIVTLPSDCAMGHVPIVFTGQFWPFHFKNSFYLIG